MTFSKVSWLYITESVNEGVGIQTYTFPCAASFIYLFFVTLRFLLRRPVCLVRWTRKIYRCTQNTRKPQCLESKRLSIKLDSSIWFASLPCSFSGVVQANEMGRDVYCWTWVGSYKAFAHLIKGNVSAVKDLLSFFLPRTQTVKLDLQQQSCNHEAQARGI